MPVQQIINDNVFGPVVVRIELDGRRTYLVPKSMEQLSSEQGWIDQVRFDMAKSNIEFNKERQARRERFERL